MSDVLLELLFNTIGALLEIAADAWGGGFLVSDTKASRIFWCVIIVLLGGIIWWEVH